MAEPELPIDPAVVPELETAQAAEPELPIDPAVVPELETAQAAELELPIDPAVVPELEIAQEVAVELQTVLVVAARQIVPVAAEPQIAQAELARGHRRAHLVALQRTRLATAPHRRGQVHLAAEDLAVAAETMRAPAAAEAIKA